MYIPDKDLKIFYASLTRDLQGHFLKFLAPNRFVVNSYMNAFYERCWCETYSQDNPPRSLILSETADGIIIDSSKIINLEPIKINDDDIEWID